MDIIHTQPNHTDQRGEIRDILIGEAIDGITHLTFAEGAVRGNHYHEQTIQWDYVPTGSLECYVRNGFDGHVEKVVLMPGDLVKHPIGEHHALKALKESSMFSFSQGPRRGTEYENDVVRLEIPLIS